MTEAARFKEAKIRMVMKVRRMSRTEAIAEINRLMVAKKKGEQADEGTKPRTKSVRRKARPAIPHKGIEMISAEEFFEDLA